MEKFDWWSLSIISGKNNLYNGETFNQSGNFNYPVY